MTEAAKPGSGCSGECASVVDGTDGAEDGRMPGWPRPRAEGMPVPFVTLMFDPDDVWWRTIDTPRLLRCQAEWLCQVCGLALPARGWVVVEADGEIVSDAALHSHCLRVAYRWCPVLKTSTYDLLEVERGQVMADGRPLASYDAGDADDEWGTYGDQVRNWTL